MERETEREDLGVWFRQGRPGAAERVVRELGPPLFRYFRRQVDSPEDARDLTQDVFVKLWQGAATYRPQGSFRGWVFRVARHVALDHHRRAVRRPLAVGVHPVPEIRDDANDPAEALSTADERNRLVTAALDLPEGEREVFLMRCESDLKFREIADALEIPLGTALARMHRAVKRLQAALEAP